MSCANRLKMPLTAVACAGAGPQQPRTARKARPLRRARSPSCLRNVFAQSTLAEDSSYNASIGSLPRQQRELPERYRCRQPAKSMRVNVPMFQRGRAAEAPCTCAPPHRCMPGRARPSGQHRAWDTSHSCACGVAGRSSRRCGCWGRATSAWCAPPSTASTASNTPSSAPRKTSPTPRPRSSGCRCGHTFSAAWLAVDAASQDAGALDVHAADASWQTGVPGTVHAAR